MGKIWLLAGAFAVGACAVATACGGSGSRESGGATSGAHQEMVPDAAASSSIEDATVSFGDPDAGGTFAPAPVDDAGNVVQTVCTAGIYQGSFMTYVGVGGDGGRPGLFSFMWNGKLSINLAARKITMTSTTTGELPTATSTTTLEIADGGALDGGDTMGGSFFANLNGELDCSPDAGPPYRLKATLSNGRYELPGYKLAMIGTLTADYQDGVGTTPSMLVNGAILVGGVLRDGGAPFASASGIWTAKWVSVP
jgi:hypothetical protein